MPTVNEAIEDVVERLGGDNAARNQLDGSVSAGDGELTFRFPLDNIAPGAMLEVDGDEACYVWDTEPASNTALVDRGQKGTTPFDYADGTLVRVQPIVFRAEVFRTIQQAIGELNADGLFVPAEADVMYDYTAGVIDVSHLDVDSFHSLVVSDGTRQYERMDFHEVGEGLLRPEFYPPLPNLKLRYRAPLRPATARTDDLVHDVGLPDTAVDLPVLGAAVRLWAVVAARRAAIQSHAGHRRPDDSTHTDVARMQQMLRSEYEGRVADEVRRLRRQMPVVVRLRGVGR